VQEARKEVWAKRKTVKCGFKRCSIPLNTRGFKFLTTKRGTPCFRVTYSPRKTFVIPIKPDNGYDRYNSFLEEGWSIKTISLLNGKIAVSLKKDYPEPFDNRRYVVGVDIGSATLAAITVFDTGTCKTIKQLYLGRDVAIRQRKYLEHRQKLQSHADTGSEKAKKYLKRLKRKQMDFVKTRSGQIAKEIVNIAKYYNASIAIEKLSIRGRRSKFNKKANRKINRIPYAQLREFLMSNCEMFETHLDQIDAYHTSKWCPYCGSVNLGHSSANYALYVCKTCGKIVNSDRKASKAIAIKSALEREHSQGLTNLFTQFSGAGVAVSPLFRPDDEFCVFAVRHITPPMESQLL
jgi:IS605 OrfB family transposase